VTACKNEHEVPWGVNRRRVVTVKDGVPGERSISVACMHCSDAPCMAVCPVDCFYKTDEGVVLHDKDLCIGCGYCFYACPFGAPQFPQAGAFGLRGKMDKCTFCAAARRRTPGGRVPQVRAQPPRRGQAPRSAPRCARPRPCSPATARSSPNIYRTRVTTRGKGDEIWGWAMAYGGSAKLADLPGGRA
jgi:formate dehydrogenase iron-sulfur subunit